MIRLMEPKRLILFAKTVQLFLSATNLLVLISTSLADVCAHLKEANPDAPPGVFLFAAEALVRMKQGHFNDGCSNNSRKQSVRGTGAVSSWPASALQRPEECVHVGMILPFKAWP